MKKLSLGLLLLALLGCNANFLGLQKKSETNIDGEALPRAQGCLAGVVKDGVTGARIDLAAAGRIDNFFVLVSDAQRFAGPLLADGEAAEYPNLVGEYTLCDVPVEAEFPLYVAIPGYQTFESVVLVPSSNASEGDGAEQDVLSQVPTLQANIRVFPVAPAGKDYQVIVSFNGAPLAGAQVQLAPTGGHVLVNDTPLDNFLDPVTTGYKTLKGSTDDAGVASFPAADLALGAKYRYLVLPVDSSLQVGGAGTVSIGYVTAPSDPYVLHVDLAQVNSELVILSRSTDSNDPSADGSISFVFNRPIELVPDTIDQAVATLDDAVKAALVVDVPGNKLSEQVEATISGQVLKLTPKFLTKPDVTVEAAIAIEYSGVRVRPTVGQKLLQQLLVSGSVKFFGGENVGTPTAVTVFTGNNQAADPGTALDEPIVAKVVDEDGVGMAGISVAFAVAAGGGTLTEATVVTDATGRASTNWTLGTTGAQSVTATAAGLTAATFTATFTITDLTLTSGNNQTGVSTAPLGDPLIVTARDASNNLVANGSVTFTVGNAVSGGKVRTVGSAGVGARTLTVLTDANGQAQATWILGSTAGTFTTAATAGTATAETFTATNVTAVLTITSGNGQGPSPINQELGTALVVTVTNLNGGAVLQDVDVQFSTTNTAGAVGATTGTATLNTIVVTTAAGTGQAQVVWKLGSAPGAQSVTAKILDATIPAAVTFTATAN